MLSRPQKILCVRVSLESSQITVSFSKWLSFHNFPHKRNIIELLLIRTKDSIELIEYAFNNFELVNIKEKIQTEFDNWKLCNMSSFKIEKGISNDLDIVLDNLPYDFLPVNNQQINSLSIYIYCNNSFKAPLMANSTIGYLTVSIGNTTVLTLNIKNTNSICQKDIKDFFNDMIRDYIYNLESIFFQ